VLLIMPLLSVRPDRWKLAGGATAGIILLTALTGFTLAQANQPRARLALPVPSTAMADPALLQAGADCPASGRSYRARRVSPLVQITPANVSALEQVWLTHTGDLPSQAAKNTYGAENTPLKIGDTLYVCTPKSIVIALDPRTGRQRWRFDPRVPDT